MYLVFNEVKKMGERTHIISKYTEKGGHLFSDSGSTVELGRAKGAFVAYELLLGALSHCLFSTFKSLAEKMQVEYDGLDFDIVGVKRDEKVATLETCDLNISATGIVDKSKFEKAIEISTRYCSVFQTLSHVAKMSWTINYL